MPPGSTIYAAHHFDPATFVVHLPARHEPAEASGSSESDACESSKRAECRTFEDKEANFQFLSTAELPRMVSYWHACRAARTADQAIQLRAGS